MVLPHHQRPHAVQNGWEQNSARMTSSTPTQSTKAPSSSQMVLAYEQPKLSITRRLGYEILTLVVGQEPNTETFAVHKNVLRELGGYCSQMCDESPSGTKVTLKTEDPEIMKLFIDFAYSNELPQVSMYATANDKHLQLRNLVQFYTFADKYELSFEVRNRIMDHIQEGFYIVGKFPEGPLIHAVYEHSAPRSMIRKFCASSMVYQLHDEQYVDDGVIASLLNSSEDMLADFLYAVRAYRHRQDPRIRHCRDDPLCVECDGTNHLAGKDGVHPCCFHIHDQIKTEDGGFVDGPCHLYKSA